MTQTLAWPALGERVSLRVLPPLALYVHIPWCVRKCPYCDFNSHEWRGAPGSGLPEQDYVEALIADLESALPQIWDRRVASVFFGGGTPSLFSGHSIDALLSAFRARIPLQTDAEITLEANPGTVEAARFGEFRSAGVNRISLGIQSFDPRFLKVLGRIHDDREAHRAVETAAKIFDNFNLDLMYALPGQTMQDAEADIAAALSSGATHLSAYHLTLEPNTLFHRHPPAALPDEDASADIHDRVEELLVAGGFGHYETSAYAREGFQCRHNLNYWRFGDYLGIGAGAHSKISFPDRIVRSARVKNPRDYMQRAGHSSVSSVSSLGGVSSGGSMRGAISEQHVVPVEQLGFEFMMNALRLHEGFAVEEFTARTGLMISAVEKPLIEAEGRGLLERDPVRIRPTARGRRFLNDLLGLFLS